MTSFIAVFGDLLGASGARPNERPTLIREQGQLRCDGLR
jgi:hypothetical protein